MALAVNENKQGLSSSALFILQKVSNIVAHTNTLKITNTQKRARTYTQTHTHLHTNTLTHAHINTKNVMREIYRERYFH